MNINMDAFAMETSQRHRSVLEDKLGYTVDKYGNGKCEKVRGPQKMKSTIDRRGPQKIKLILLN
jgi:hypothetical protein